jgi:predicted metal-binding membrane protein
MTEAAGFERLLRRDRWITIAALGTLCTLAWLYVLGGAGLGMSAWDMTTLALFPHRQSMGMDMSLPDMAGMTMPGMEMAPRAWSAQLWAISITMWWVMMIAMMTPSAAPAILLFARVHRQAAASGGVAETMAPTGPFAGGYLAVWLAFSVAATALYWLLTQAGLASDATMASQSRWLSGGVLIAAGLYQLSPLKGVCLSHCRAPASFLSRHWRPGAGGAFRLGVLHGAYCVGCCWLLMALLFVGGVMNLAWIAAIAVLVLAEKAAPGGRWLSRAAALVLLAWGAATFFA